MFSSDMPNSRLWRKIKACCGAADADDFQLLDTATQRRCFCELRGQGITYSAMSRATGVTYSAVRWSAYHCGAGIGEDSSEDSSEES